MAIHAADHDPMGAKRFHEEHGAFGISGQPVARGVRIVDDFKLAAQIHFRDDTMPQSSGLACSRAFPREDAIEWLEGAGDRNAGRQGDINRGQPHWLQPVFERSPIVVLLNEVWNFARGEVQYRRDARTEAIAANALFGVGKYQLVNGSHCDRGGLEMATDFMTSQFRS